MNKSFEELFYRIKANAGLIFANTYEEQRIVREIKRNFSTDSVQFWSSTQGLHEIPVDQNPDTIKIYEFNPKTCRKAGNGTGKPIIGNPLDLFDAIEEDARKKIEQESNNFLKTIYIIRDADKFFNNPVPIRKLRDIVYLVSTANSSIIITGPGIKVPAELEKDSAYIELGLLQYDEIRSTIIEDKIGGLIKSHNAEINDGIIQGDLIDDSYDVDVITKSCTGLTEDEIYNTIGYSISKENTLNPETMLEEKRNIINKNDILTFWPCNDSLNSVGGFDNLKKWFMVQKAVIDNTEQAEKFCADQPKGIMILGVQGSGKGQPLHYPVKTPNGWKTIGSLVVGDKIISPKGNIESITGIYDKGIKPTYEITFSDGRKTECCEDHLWKIYNKSFKNHKDSNDGWIICDTTKLIQYMNSNSSTRKFYIPLVNDDKVTADKDFYINPYIMGVLIGDGCLTTNNVQFTNSETEIISNVEELLDQEYKIRTDNRGNNFISLISNNGHTLNKYKEELKRLGLFGKLSYEKYIPEEYKNGSFAQKIELIQGLMDTDGSADNSLSYSTTSKQLADDIIDIIRSIGGIAYYSIRNTKYTHNNEINNIRRKTSYRINIRYNDPKMLVTTTKHKNKLSNNYQYNDLKLEIIDIKRVEDQEIRCIYIDSDDHLYITNDYIVTHNTHIAKAIAKELGKGAIKLDMGKVFAGLVGESEKRMRMALAQAEAAGGVVIIDELDKGLAGAGSSDKTDGGTTKRVIGTLLTWMQEPHPGVFIVATANDITSIRNAHPELLRKGRFDEIWFSDIPNQEERKNIFEIHLKKRNRTVSKIDTDELSKLKYKDGSGNEYDYTGAEIEYAIKEAISHKLAENIINNKKSTPNGKYDIYTDDIKSQLLSIKPIVKVGAAAVKNMRDWAKDNARNVSSLSDIITISPKNNKTKTKTLNTGSLRI